MRQLDRIVKSISKDHPEVEKIVLFGSVAGERAVPGSDVDILIVGEFDKRLHERSMEFLRYFEDLDVPVDVFCYTPEEVERVGIARRAIETGKVLFERAKTSPRR